MILDDFLKLTEEDYSLQIFNREGDKHVLTGKVSSEGIDFVKYREIDGFSIDYSNQEIHVFLKDGINHEI